MDKEKSRIYQSMVSNIRTKLSGRPYSVGLDLGVGSIGIALVALEPDDKGSLFPTDIVFASSRIFQSSAGAKDRQKKRAQRNSFRHKANRMKKLWKILSEKGLMLPYSQKDNIDSAKLRFADAELRKDPYSLRLKGLYEKLTLPELGVALYHIAGHRGASSIRSILDENNEDLKESEKLRQTEKIAAAEHLNTFIEVLYKSKEINNTNFRNTPNSASMVPLPTRDIINKEFDKLMKCQKFFYPNILNDEYVNKIKDAIFFENEKIVPESGSCPYFKSEKRLPKAAFINEERRIWEAVNNVRVLKRGGVEDRFKTVKTRLNDTERYQLYNVLRNGAEISVSSFKKMFPQYNDYDEIILQGETKKTQKLIGFRYKNLENANWFKSLTDEKQLAFIVTYVNCPDDKEFKAILQKDFFLSDKEIDEALSISLPSGYAPVGFSAMKIILEYIKKDGMSYQEAEIRAIEEGRLESDIDEYEYDFLPYYGMVIPSCTQAIAGKAWHRSFEGKRNAKGFVMPITNKEEEKYGKIANPVVHQTLNELRNLMNELLSVIGYKPEYICIELSRALKIGKEKRDKISIENSKREKENEAIYNKYCKKIGLSKKYIRLFKLYEEQKYICPYCLQTITVDDIIHNRADVDHIFPKADTGDSSFNNLVLAHKDCNENKKQKKIPYAAFSSDPELWSRIEQNVLETFPQIKARRFLTTSEEYEKYLAEASFAPRFSPDNAYIARIACNYLRSLYAKDDRLSAVRTIKSSETAVLRKAWDLNKVTAQLADNLSGKKHDEYKKSKDRTDHRHHALDAIVIAYFSPSYSQAIAKAILEGHSMSEILERLPVPKYYRIDKSLSRHEQVEVFSKDIQNFILNSAFVSRKHSVNKNGELVKDTMKSVLSINGNDVVICSKKSIADVDAVMLAGRKGKTLERILKGDFKLPAKISDTDKSRILDYLSKNSSKYDAIVSNLRLAEERLKSDNAGRIEKGLKPRAVTEKAILSVACKITGGSYYQIDNQKRFKLFIKPDGSAAFDTGENFSLDLFLDSNGKLCGEVIRKISVNNPKFVPEYKKSGYVLFERIYQNDILEIDLKLTDFSDKKTVSQSFVTPNAPSGRTFIVIDTFTEIGNSIQVHYSPLVTSSEEAKSSFYVSSIEKMNARKVVLSSLGLVLYRSKLLKGI